MAEQSSLSTDKQATINVCTNPLHTKLERDEKNEQRMMQLARKRLEERMADPSRGVSEAKYQQMLADAGLTE